MHTLTLSTLLLVLQNSFLEAVAGGNSTARALQEDSCYVLGSSSGSEGWLNDHNYYRALFDAEPVSWDADLEAKAKTWADTLNEANSMYHSDCYNTWPYSGENLAMGYRTQEAATTAWIQTEYELWMCQGKWEDVDGVGHLTAAVWKGIDLIGCAQTGSYYVCEYGSVHCKEEGQQYGGSGCYGTTPSHLPNFNSNGCHDTCVACKNDQATCHSVEGDSPSEGSPPPATSSSPPPSPPPASSSPRSPVGAIPTNPELLFPALLTACNIFPPNEGSAAQAGIVEPPSLEPPHKYLQTDVGTGDFTDVKRLCGCGEWLHWHAECAATCYDYTCDHWGQGGYTCSVLEGQYGCDCSGCECAAVAPPPTPPSPPAFPSPPPFTSAPTSSDGALPACTAPADGSRGQCESCLTAAQCPDGYFCCPYMKKCVASSSMGCSYPIANCNDPRCYDSSCNDEGCDCEGCAEVGEGKTYGWLEWVNLGRSNSGASKAELTCSESTSAPPPSEVSSSPPPSAESSPPSPPPAPSSAGKMCHNTRMRRGAEDGTGCNVK
ncbi:hypothetical protein CYMTET_27375 [Cymbomonas tetramitiformis]|uniref:SCP domain-containing protein n=1 Tax=Cymbomonas tetramitiformis TaxID=36881 RepID=A0AAE0FPZ6_9CHLO|nr:hypothetical protein CYMTET_27375 [Cymbomonas tetramitiformis]